MIKLLTVDITNTVIRVLGSPGQQYAMVAAIYGVEADPQKLNIAFKDKWKEQNFKHPNFGVSSGMTAHAWWNELVKQCFDSSGIKKSDTVSKIATHLYLHYTTAKAWEVMPEANEVLRIVKSKGLQICALSNFDERLEKILRSLGLLHYFDFVLGSQLLGHAKPDPEIFGKALQLAAVSASEALHVGDNVETDYIGARNVGMKSVLFCKDVNTVPECVDKQYVISKLSDILEFI